MGVGILAASALLLWLMLTGLAILGFLLVVWAIDNALRVPNEVWAATGQSRRTWIVLMALATLCGLGVLGALGYRLRAYPRLRAAGAGSGVVVPGAPPGPG